MSLPLKWEFPGGKIEKGESNEQCLQREIKEELGLQIEIQKPLTRVEHHYPTFQITLYPYLCTIKSGTLKPLEHAKVRWEPLEALENYDWAEADLPIVQELITL